MLKPKIIIRIEGGIIQQINSNMPELSVMVIDNDLIKEDGSIVEGVYETDEVFEDGKAHLLYTEQEIKDKCKQFNY